MGIAEIMREIRKLPDDELLALAAQVDEEAARAVDHRFESLVREGRFEDLASEALRLKGGIVAGMVGSASLMPSPGTDPLHDVLQAKYIR